MMQKPYILIVDDEEPTREIMEESIAQMEFAYKSVANAEEALSAIEEKKPDVCLIDIMMPKVNGFSLCKILKSNANTKNIKIILVSALKEKEYIAHGLEIGADDFLSKPLSMIELKARITNIIRINETYAQLKELTEFKKQLATILLESIEDPINEIIYSSKELDKTIINNNFISTIISSSMSIKNSVSQILTVYNSSSNNIPLEPKQVSLELFLKDLININKKQERKTTNKVIFLEERSLLIDLKSTMQAINNIFLFADSIYKRIPTTEISTTFSVVNKKNSEYLEIEVEYPLDSEINLRLLNSSAMNATDTLIPFNITFVKNIITNQSGTIWFSKTPNNTANVTVTFLINKAE